MEILKAIVLSQKILPRFFLVLINLEDEGVDSREETSASGVDEEQKISMVATFLLADSSRGKEENAAKSLGKYRAPLFNPSFSVDARMGDVREAAF